jgi:hypothetical protein
VAIEANFSPLSAGLAGLSCVSVPYWAIDLTFQDVQVISAGRAARGG